MNTEITKADLPSFVKVKNIGPGRDKGEWVEVEARFNPFYVTSYYERFLENYKGEELKKVICFIVASAAYYVDMTIEEADKMMEDIDRGLSYK